MATHFMGGLAMRPVSIADGTTYTVKAKDSGKVHIVPDLTADITITLPAVEDGLAYRFIYGGAAADAQDWAIATAATDELYKGGLVHIDSDANSAGDEAVPVYADASDDDTMTILTPEAGTVVEIVSDGVSWYVTGTVVSATAPTFA